MPRVILPLLVVLLTAATGPGPALSAQSSLGRGLFTNRGAGVERLHLWVEAVRQHRLGTADEWSARVSAWSPDDLADLWLELRSLLALLANPSESTFLLVGSSGSILGRVLYSRSELERLRALAQEVSRHADGVAVDGDRSAHPRNALLKRGALLHTDIVIHEGDVRLTAPPRPSGACATLRGVVPCPARTVIRYADGRRLGVERLTDHWWMARLLLNGVHPSPARDPFVRLWYRATAAQMQDQAQLSSEHLEHARSLFPDDPELLFLTGTLHEALGNPRMQAVVAEGRVRIAGSEVRAAPVEWRHAEDFFRRAIAADPEHLEARTRLARVLVLQRRYPDALRETAHVLAAADDPVLRFHAALFHGASAEVLGDSDRARAAYGLASTIAPRAPSPHLALSQLARHAGDIDAALASVLAAVTIANPYDPWWDYHIAQGRLAPQRLADLRELLEPPAP